LRLFEKNFAAEEKFLISEPKPFPPAWDAPADPAAECSKGSGGGFPQERPGNVVRVCQ
jgi:hypothetical protein